MPSTKTLVFITGLVAHVIALIVILSMPEVDNAWVALVAAVGVVWCGTFYYYNRSAVRAYVSPRYEQARESVRKGYKGAKNRLGLRKKK